MVEVFHLFFFFSLHLPTFFPLALSPFTASDFPHSPSFFLLLSNKNN